MSTPRASKIRMCGNDFVSTGGPYDPSRNRWALVLAGGSGTRLRSLTTLDRGVSVPKQYCSLNGGPSLLRHAVSRASMVVRADRVLVVVAESHRQWWQPELSELPAANC